MQRALLPVQIIGPVIVLQQQRVFVHHLRNVLVLICRTVDHKVRRAFERQRMHRDVFGPKGNGLLQAALKPRHRVFGQACDEVHIDIVVPNPAGCCVAVQNILGSVFAPNCPKHFVAERLWVDGDAGGPVFFKHYQLFFVGTIRAAGLHRVLLQRGKVYTVPHRAHQLAQLRRRDSRGGAPADIHRTKL
ncbi:hypothetical protein SDC9_163193 [bioreactor metagenome]|uniref:Uncharacterized protein n=1 Tax=bioreactor metagenome TaxID=1076179 RepID=A0A645FN56_9ZZZZ